MDTKRLWLKRMALGGLVAVGAVLALILLLNLLANGVIWGERLDYYNFQFTTDRCAYEFGSAALAVTVELCCVFALGAAIGLATLPFAETWTSLLGLSILHFVITGGLALLAGWSYRWLSLSWQMFLAAYVVIYLVIWLVRWLVWYSELRRMRKALHLE